MAMWPFCGYNMGDYFQHWLDVGAKLTNPPRIFRVNWFRTNEDGRFLWPGFGDNLRVLKWILERCDGQGKAVDTVIGSVPTLDAIDRSGLSLSDSDMAELLQVDPAEWVEAIAGQEELLQMFGDRMPKELRAEHEELGAPDQRRHHAARSGRPRRRESRGGSRAAHCRSRIANVHVNAVGSSRTAPTATSLTISIGGPHR